MCGRYGITSSREEMRDYFGLVDFEEFDIHYNIGPQTRQPVIHTNQQGNRALRMMTWGLVPHWSKDRKVGYSTFNARAEDIMTKPAFKEAIQTRRCIVPADVFYEWKGSGRSRQPYAVRMKSGEPLALAGIWEQWEAKGQAVLESFSIITTGANEALLPIHERMPVLLKCEDFDRWLTTPASSEPPLDLLRPMDADKLEVWPVDRRVGRIENNDPGLLCEAPPSQLMLIPLEGTER